MFKTLLTIVVLTSSFTAFAQSTTTREKRSTQERIEGSFPETKEVESKDEYRIHMGLTAGVSSPNGDAESSTEYGINIGFQPVVPLGVGVEVTTAELDETNVQRTAILPRATYNFGGDIPVLRHSYVGVTSGPVFVDSNVELAVGPLAGFDIPLQPQSSNFLSLGLQAKYLYITDTQDTFSAALALKYWY
ncbi:MAG: hypothetical protein K2Q18_06210 [Bdellovibrionales bacterium]|nr:hypothetical protein [Bdellovibrionales bacterium]